MLDTVVRAAFKKRRHVGAVFFDIEGAYDTTWRHGILLKAFNHGIRGPMGLFLQNFLAERHFRVRVGQAFSDRFLQLNGVPQGGVLSVALFALMISDVGDSLPQGIGRSLFVDDLAVWCSASTAPAVCQAFGSMDKGEWLSFFFNQICMHALLPSSRPLC